MLLYTLCSGWETEWLRHVSSLFRDRRTWSWGHSGIRHIYFQIPALLLSGHMTLAISPNQSELWFLPCRLRTIMILHRIMRRILVTYGHMTNYPKTLWLKTIYLFLILRLCWLSLAILLFILPGGSQAAAVIWRLNWSWVIENHSQWRRPEYLEASWASPFIWFLQQGS